MAPSERHPRLLIRQEMPLNAGPAPDVLLDSFATPNELFFVRNHGDVPAVDPGGVPADGRRAGGAAALALAGRSPPPPPAHGRRHPPVRGQPPPRDDGGRARSPASSPGARRRSATPSGPGFRLREVLAAAGPRSGARHAAFLGLDETERHGHRFNFGGSIPLAKALHPEVLLADTMNGEPLPRDPRRAAAGGGAGLHRRPQRQVAVADHPAGAAVRQLLPGQGLPALPTRDRTGERRLGDRADARRVARQLGDLLAARRRGAAGRTGDGARLGGGGRGSGGGAGGRLGGRRPDLDRPRISAPARPAGPGASGRRRSTSPPGEHEICCRAFDSAAQTQPSDPAQVWNFKGYANNAWHRVRVVAG